MSRALSSVRFHDRFRLVLGRLSDGTLTAMSTTAPDVDGYQFLGFGPRATGDAPGWTVHPGLFIRCARCGDLLRLDPTCDATCGCGRLAIDSGGRLGATDGDGSIAVYSRG